MAANNSDIHQSYSKHFNENYQFSKKLIEKLVERTMKSSPAEDEKTNKIHIKFPPPAIKEKKMNSLSLMKRNDGHFQDNEKEIKDSQENHHHHHHQTSLPNDFFEVTSILPNSNPKLSLRTHNNHDNDNDDDHDYEDDDNVHNNNILGQPSSPVFVGGQLLPEFQKLKSRVQNSKGFIDLSNQNFGNHRIVVFTETLAASAKESEIHSLSLRGNRLTDVGICEIVHQLNCSPHKNLISLDLSSNKIGRSGAITLGSYLRRLHFLQRLNLSNTSLGDGNARLLLHAWNNPADILNQKDLESLADDESLDEDIFKEDNDEANLSLISLRIANNKIEKSTAKELAKFLKNVGSCLAELDISWNELRAQGSAYLWQTLAEHPALTSLDISWNSLGIWNTDSKSTDTSQTISISTSNSKNSSASTPSNKLDRLNHSVLSVNSTTGSNRSKVGEGSCAREISRLLSSNDRLLHLNISQNKFSPTECDLISQGLQQNHTLLGIHITGNCCRMDNHGTMTSETTPWPLESSHLTEQIIRDTVIQPTKMKSHSYHTVSKTDLAYLRNCCWICESWQEVEFSYQLSEKDMLKLNEILKAGERAVGVNKLAQEKEKLSKAFPVHMFASFDNWFPERMLLRENKDVDKIASYVHQTLKRAQPPSKLSPTKPSMPPPSHLRRLSVSKGRNVDHSTPTPPNPHPPPPTNRMMIRRRTSVQHENIPEIPKKQENTTPSTQQVSSTSETGTFILRSETYAYDSSSDEESKITNNNDPTSRKLTFANTKYLLHSFESGHWSMMGGIEDDESDDDEDFSSSLLSHPTTGLKMSKNAGPGVFVSARVTPQVDVQRPVYSLRRMVPPGRHAYVFSVGATPDNLEEQASFIVYDPSQPHNATTSVVTSEKIKEANTLGIDLPEFVNTLFIFDKNSFYKAKMKNPHIPDALTIGNLLSHPRSARPRSKNLPILRPLQRIWHDSDSLMHQQWLARQSKQLMECFQSDWSYGKTCRVFSKDEVELSGIKDVLMKYYSLLVDIFTYYCSVYSGDVAIGLGGMAFNEIILQCYILEPVIDKTDNTLTKLEMHTGKQVIPLQHISATNNSPPTSTLPTIQIPNNNNNGSSNNNNNNNNNNLPSSSPSAPRPSVRATLLLKQIQQQVVKSPSFIKEHGLEGYSSYQSTPQRPSNSSTKEQYKTEENNEDFTDDELEKFEIDSEMGGDEEEREEGGGEEEEDEEEEKESFHHSNHNHLQNEQLRKNHEENIEKKVVLRSPRGRQPVVRGAGNGSIGRAEVDMVFVSGCVSGPKVRTNHKRTLTRFQFLDAVVSLSCLKFIQSQICFDVADAVEKFCVEILGQYATRERDELLLSILVSKQVDNILRLYMKDIEKIFKKFASGADSLPLKTRLLSFSAWQQFLQQSGLRFGERTQRIIFGQSKSAFPVDVLDELYDTKNLYFMEFVEALVRCAFSQRKEALENGLNDEGGLTSQTISTDLEEMIKQIRGVLLRKN